MTDFELVGKYARLTPLNLSHAQALIDAAGASRTTYQFTSVPNDLKSARLYVERALDLKAKGDAYPFATVDKSSGKVVGTTRFMTMERWRKGDDSPGPKTKPNPDVLEIGATWLAEDVQRTGINTDAKLLMLTHAFEVWNVARVSLKTDARNERSRRNIERVGAKFDGILRAHMPAYDGGIRNTAFYSIVANEWPEVREALKAKLK